MQVSHCLPVTKDLHGHCPLPSFKQTTEVFVTPPGLQSHAWHALGAINGTLDGV